MATGGEGTNVLQFLPFSSSLDPGFWHELGKRKLEEYQLREDPVPIRGIYGNYRMIQTPFLSLDYDAFDVQSQPPGLDFPSPGLLRNVNTIASFKKIDKKELLDSCGRLILENIKNRESFKNPSLLTSFLLLTYADLKKYRFNYWFGFPALSPSSPFTYRSISRLDTLLKDSDLQYLISRYDEFQVEHKSVGFFLVDREGSQLTPKPLTAFEKVFKKGSDKLMIGFCDPSTLDSNPGWPLRNFLYFISHTWGNVLKEVDVLCYRDNTQDGKRLIGHSLLVEGVALSDRHGDDDPLPKITGWERNKVTNINTNVHVVSVNMYMYM